MFSVAFTLNQVLHSKLAGPCGDCAVCCHEHNRTHCVALIHIAYCVALASHHRDLGLLAAVWRRPQRPKCLKCLAGPDFWEVCDESCSWTTTGLTAKEWKMLIELSDFFWSQHRIWCEHNLQVSKSRFSGRFLWATLKLKAHARPKTECFYKHIHKQMWKNFYDCLFEGFSHKRKDR